MENVIPFYTEFSTKLKILDRDDLLLEESNKLATGTATLSRYARLKAMKAKANNVKEETTENKTDEGNNVQTIDLTGSPLATGHPSSHPTYTTYHYLDPFPATGGTLLPESDELRAVRKLYWAVVTTALEPHFSQLVKRIPTGNFFNFSRNFNACLRVT